jgi:GDSL-like Lipase/Acylhydrolase family
MENQMEHSQPCNNSKKQSKVEKNPAFEPVLENPKLPRVLLIGDSISIGYTLGVRNRLAGKANVLRPACNCRTTEFGLEELDDWLGEKPWDIIHFNWGLHDLRYLSEETDQQMASPKQYEENMEKLVARLESANAKLIWASLTPVPEGAALRKPEDAIAYNAIASRIMEESNIEINDLHAAVLPNLETCQLPQNVHFNEHGYDFLAERVAKTILKIL